MLEGGVVKVGEKTPNPRRGPRSTAKEG